MEWNKMPKEIAKVETEPDLYGTGNDPLEYLPTERDKEREKININYSNSLLGRSGAAVGRFNLQLCAWYNQSIVFISGQTLLAVTELAKGIDILGIILYNEYCNKKLRKDKKTMSKTINKTDKNTKNNSEKAVPSSKGIDFKAWGRGIIGIMTLFVVVSIAYSAWVIIQETDDQVHRIMVVPMVIWAAVKLIQQFSKQGDK